MTVIETLNSTANFDFDFIQKLNKEKLRIIQGCRKVGAGGL
jgi:hypothetical protein